MSKRTVIGILVLFFVIGIFGLTFFLVDFNLVVRDNEPRLSVMINTCDEGTTKEYLGLGYKIIRYNIQSDSSVNKFGTWFMMYDPDFVIKSDFSSNDYITYDIIGEIVTFDEKELFIEVVSNSSNSNYERAIVKLDSNTIIKKDNKEINIKNFKVGDNVKVVFNGMVTRSIPPQAVALTMIVQ